VDTINEIGVLPFKIDKKAISSTVSSYVFEAPTTKTNL
jgi:hypothetical protein